MATIDDIYKLVVENRNALNDIIANAKATGDLDPATPLSGVELIRIVQNGVSKWTTTDELRALGGGGEDNVQADWEQSDIGSDDYIKNKPVNLSDFNDDLGYASPVWGAITGTLSNQVDLQAALTGKANTSHSHVIGDTTGLQTALDAKIDSIVAGTNITVDISDPANPIVNSTLTFPTTEWGTLIGTLSDQTDLQSALDGKADTSHTHTIAQVANLQTTLDGKAAVTHVHGTYDRATSVLSGATVFSDIVIVDGIVQSSATRTLTAADISAANASHGHVISDVTGLQTAIDGKVSSIVAGTNVTVDNTDPMNPIVSSTAGGTVSAWGDIGGTISDQTDLQAALDAKVDIFQSALSKTADYSTASNNTESGKVLIFGSTGAPHVITLNDTDLTTGFEQQIFNDSGQDITITSSETINGANIPLVNGYFAYYKLVAANEWLLSVGGSAGGGTGGAVDSVNGMTGVVVLDNTDVGAAATSHAHAIADTTGLQAALDNKVEIFQSALSKTADYTTELNNSESGKVLIFSSTGAPHTITLSDTGLTVGFEQQIFNDSGVDLTITSSETINGSNIPLANGYFAYYKLVATNEWLLSVGGSSGGGGGTVDSVNGQTGAVTLDYTDVGASATSHTHLIADTTGLQTALDGKSATTHTHGTYDRLTSALTGTNVFSDLVVTDGIVQSVATRSLTAADIGAATTSHTHNELVGGFEFTTSLQGLPSLYNKSNLFTISQTNSAEDNYQGGVITFTNNAFTKGLLFGSADGATAGGSLNFLLYNGVDKQITSNMSIAETDAAPTNNVVSKEWVYDKAVTKTIGAVPASATATGTAGEVRFTADYIYVCIATNTWKRVAISTW